MKVLLTLLRECGVDDWRHNANVAEQLFQERFHSTLPIQ